METDQDEAVREPYERFPYPNLRLPTPEVAQESESIQPHGPTGP